MRYVVRHNATPEGTALVRMEIAAGSLDELDDELGFAHFVEHMAFNGSANVPEGEMVRLLERDGLAFGADTNASTSFDRTTYKLDLPRNDTELLDTALMLMRETASELSFSPGAVAREKGVLLAEMRDRNSYALRNAKDSTRFLHPDALYPRRFPIGTAEALEGATAEALKTFWAREYVPAHTVLVVVGDFDADMVEDKIRERFGGWQPRPAESQPDGGPVDYDDRGRTEIYTDPALPERVTVTKHGPWLNEPDTVAQRQENLLRRIGYDIVNRRLQRLSRQAKPPFRGAGFGTGDIFEAGRSTRLIVDTSDRTWRRGLVTAAQEYRRALRYGFTEAEVAEQVANIRTAVQNSAASADTRSHHALVATVWELVRDDAVPSDPRTVLERFEAFSPNITPERVLAALKREAIPLDDPLLRFRGRFKPDGGARAIRNAWNEAMRAPLARQPAEGTDTFAYTDFGPAGDIVSDTREPALGIRMLRFANGVMLNLKRTDLEADTIRVRLRIDGGRKLNRRDNPLVTELIPYLAEGGLARHSEDDLQTILAGRTVQNEFRAKGKAFEATARTTPRDLEVQLELLAAYLTDPGYRPEGIERYRQDINRYFAQIDATPSSALRAAIGGIVSDDDPRFALLEPEAYRGLTFEKFASDIADRLRSGAIEIGIVGDFQEEQAIALVARSFGALPAREPDFRTYDDQPPRTFTADRSRRIVRHTGPKDQALLRLAWPTRDDSDPVEATQLELLERVVKIGLTETLRESLGKAYSPGAASSLSHSWKGYGTFGIAASVDVKDLPATREAIRETITKLRQSTVSEDLFQRARQPLVEGYDNALKTNSGWLSLVGRAQSEGERIDRHLKGKERLLAAAPADVQDMAQRYLDPDEALEILVLPEDVEQPDTQAPL